MRTTGTAITAIIVVMLACNAAIADMTIGEAKLLPNGFPVSLANKQITEGALESPTVLRGYIQEPNRSSGIAILVPMSMFENAGIEDRGQQVNVTGTMATVGGERCVNVTEMSAGLEFLELRPLGFERVCSPSGLSPLGLYIRTWGECVALPTPEPGNYPRSFTVRNASGTFEVGTQWEDSSFLMPEVGTYDAFTGAYGRDSSAKPRLYYTYPYENGRTGSVASTYGTYELEVNVGDEAGTVTSMDVMAPYHTQWMPLQLKEDNNWYLLETMPEQLPATPFKCRFRITSPAGQWIYVCWVTDYMRNAFATDSHPIDGEHVSNPVTFTWAKPAGGPYHYQVVLLKNDYGFVGEIDAGSDSTSITYSMPGPGWYWYWVRTLDADGNSANAQSFWFYCD